MKLTKITKEHEAMFRPFFTKGAASGAPDLIRIGITDDKKRAAGALAARLDEGQADIASLYIIPELRKKGYAGSLISSLEDAVKDQGFDAITAEFLETEDATGFFYAMGFGLFGGNRQYHFTLGELLRSPLYRKYIKGKKPKHISNVSELTSKNRKALDNVLQFKDYDPDWSTASVIDGKYLSCMLAEPAEDAVSIVWLDSRTGSVPAILQHFRALADKAIENYGENMDMVFRMIFEDEGIVLKLAPLLGGMAHIHSEGRIINAIKLI